MTTRAIHLAAILVLAGSVGAPAQSDGAPMGSDILDAYAAFSNDPDTTQGVYVAERDGEIMRQMAPDGFTPIQEFRATDKVFCEPFTAFGTGHWACTAMLEFRKGAVPGGRDAETRNRAAIEALASQPFREIRMSPVLVRRGEGFVLSMDYVRPLPQGGVEVRDGPRFCQRFLPAASGGVGYQMSCSDDEEPSPLSEMPCGEYQGPGPDPDHPWRAMPGLDRYHGRTSFEVTTYFTCDPDPAYF